MSKKENDENARIAHLAMLQGIITRMGANSFTLKALSVSFGGGAIAVTATIDKHTVYFGLAAVIPILMFWLMDAQYLRYERAYIRLFNQVRGGDYTPDFSLDATEFMGNFHAILKVAVSWSLALFYGPILIGLVSIILLQTWEG